MATPVLCIEDSEKPAICCCICAFPLPLLCEDHLAAHSSEDEDFQHFHLPLTALKDISNPEARLKCLPWLQNLHSAYGEVKKNLDEISSFENLLESSRLEVLQFIEDQFTEAKEKLTSLRSALKSELLSSMHATTSHALEAWTPEDNSLSALLWNYDPDKPETLKLFHFKVDREFMNLNRVFSYSVDTGLLSLTQMCQYSTRESISLETWDSVSDTDPHFYDSNEIKRQLEELTVQHSSAQQEIKKLQSQNSHLLSECSSLRAELANVRRTLHRDRSAAKASKQSTRPISTSPRAALSSLTPPSLESCSWAMKEGLILSSTCYNRQCKVYDVLILDLKGFGEFGFDRETRCWKCPECALKTGGLARVMFYKAKWRVEAELRTGEKRTFAGIADKEELHTFTEAKDLSWANFSVSISRLEC